MSAIRLFVNRNKTVGQLDKSGGENGKLEVRLNKFRGQGKPIKGYQ